MDDEKGFFISYNIYLSILKEKKVTTAAVFVTAVIKFIVAGFVFFIKSIRYFSNENAVISRALEVSNFTKYFLINKLHIHFKGMQILLGIF